MTLSVSLSDCSDDEGDEDDEEEEEEGGQSDQNSEVRTRRNLTELRLKKKKRIGPKLNHPEISCNFSPANHPDVVLVLGAGCRRVVKGHNP